MSARATIAAVMVLALAGAAAVLAPAEARAQEAAAPTGTARADGARTATGTARAAAAPAAATATARPDGAATATRTATAPARATTTTGTAASAAGATATAAPVVAGPPLEARVVYLTADGLYVDGGTEAGLTEGATGSLVRGAVPLGRFTVGRASAGSAFLRLPGAATGKLPAAGETITLLVDRPAGGAAGAAGAGAAPMGTRAPSRTLKEGETEAFVPLLADPDLGDQAATEARNVFHGRITARQAAQVGTRHGDLDYALTRVRTSGSLDRIDATPWAIEWSGELSYRGGDGLSLTRNQDQLRAELFQLSLFRRFEDRGFIRLGRFLPRELPSAGFLDGVHGEAAFSDQHVRVGAMAGWKPTRDRLRPTLDEPTAAAYLTVVAGEPAGVRYFGTAGVLGSLYEGHADRLAFLLDQRLDSGKLSLYSTSEVDFDIDHDDKREGTRLTRWNLLGTWDAAGWLRLGAGLDRFEIPDTEGEREISEPGFLPEDELFDAGYWRYYGRATLRPSDDLSLEGEGSFTDEDGEVEDAWRGSLSLTHQGLLGAPLSSVTLAVYNLRSEQTSGWGARLSALIPLAEDRVSLQPSVSVRWAEHGTAGARFFDETDGDRLTVVDVSLRAQWVLSRAWTLFGGASYARTDDEGRLLVDVGVTWRW